MKSKPYQKIKISRSRLLEIRLKDRSLKDKQDLKIRKRSYETIKFKLRERIRTGGFNARLRKNIKDPGAQY